MLFLKPVPEHWIGQEVLRWTSVRFMKQPTQAELEADPKFRYANQARELFIFRYRGYDCCIWIHGALFMSWFAGYVQLPPDHPDIDYDYDEVPIRVHGGLTYHEERWYGFDTNHGRDLTLKEVIENCRMMVIQFEARHPDWLRTSDPASYQEALYRYSHCNSGVYFNNQ